MIVCEITNPFYAELTAGVDEALDKAGWIAFLANADESPARQDRFIARLREQRVDGVIIAPAEGTSPDACAQWRRQGLPVVQVLRRFGRSPGDYVSADFRLGMTLAVERLMGLGHRRIAFIGGARRVSTARDRADAFRVLLSRHGAAAGPIVPCLPTREDGARAASQLFAGRADDPTAVICHNDLCALGLMVGLEERGLKPGRDVAVIGFDNISEGALHRPALTSVAIGARDIGREAAKLLLRRIASPEGKPESIILPPKLVVRASCGAQLKP
jgi:LacI family transcriptional regulator